MADATNGNGSNDMELRALGFDVIKGSIGGSILGVFSADVFSALASNTGAFVTSAQAGPLGVAIGAVVAVGIIAYGLQKRHPDVFG